MGEVWHGEITWAKYLGGERQPDDATDFDLQVVSVPRPSRLQVDEIGRKLNCNAQVMARARESHQRARADRYGDSRFLMLRPARYVDKTETVDFGELQLIVGPDYVVILARCGIFDLKGFLQGIEKKPAQLATGPSAVLHAALDTVVDGYQPVIEGLENDIDEIEDQVFQTDEEPLRRIYELVREVMNFQRATDPLEQLLAELLRNDGLSDEERRYVRDAHERSLHASERASSFRALLENVLSVNLALTTKRLSEISVQQNDQMKKISGWAAILFTPALVAGIYGMNFRHMPELAWQYGYPMSLAVMLGLVFALYVVFKKNDWL